MINHLKIRFENLRHEELICNRINRRNLLVALSMTIDCLGIEFFRRGKEKLTKKNWKTDVYAQNEIHWFPSLSAVRKSNFLEYSSLELFYVTVLDQKREKVKHRMVFLFVPRTKIWWNRGKVKTLLEGNISCETTNTSILPTFIKRKNTRIRLKS